MLFASLLALVALAGVGFLVGVDAPTRNDVARDADLCPIDAYGSGGDAVILFDFTKPLDGASAKQAEELLRNVTLDLEPDAEIRAYLLTGSADAPLALLRRFCKPFDSDEIQVAQAKDQQGAARDCDDLPAQVASDVRKSAGRFCALRKSLQSRVRALVEKASREESEVVSNAYLVEALEDIRIEFQERSGQHRLHIFSDMMQHAQWYSHLDLDWSQWNYDEFLTSLATRDRIFEQMFGQRRYAPEVSVDIHYLPRVGLTKAPEAREQHQDFWRSYFAGASLAFLDQSPNPAYSSRSLMGSAAESEPGFQATLGTKRFLASAGRYGVVGAGPPQDTVAVGERQAGAEVLERPANRRRAVPRQPLRPPSVQASPEQQAGGLIKVATLPVLHEGMPKPPAQRAAGSPPGSGADVAPGTPAEFAPGTLADVAPDTFSDILPSALADEPTREQQSPSTAQRKAEPLEVVVAEDPPVELPGTSLAEQARPARYSNEDELQDLAGISGSQATAQDAVSCQLQRRGDLDRWRPRYPLQGHRDFGDAVIAVRYPVDETGETIDEEIAVITDESSADFPRHFSRFAREALRSVRNWEFAFGEQASQTCAFDTSFTTAIRFKYQ